ncbi:MAG: AbrB/MazE/SpoVT family DNA-binding domain-containing protein [Pseudonocardia sp.]
MAALPTPRPHDAAVSGMAAVDDRGRITDHVVLRALRWASGTSVGLEVSGGVATLTARPGGAGCITCVGRFRLPASVRHQLHLAPGDRVLLVAQPAASQLVVHPPAALDAILPGTGPSSPGDPA